MSSMNAVNNLDSFLNYIQNSNFVTHLVSFLLNGCGQGAGWFSLAVLE